MERRKEKKRRRIAKALAAAEFGELEEYVASIYYADD
jgi:hypothetical protein